jgi:hypothetical protein
MTTKYLAEQTAYRPSFGLTIGLAVLYFAQ